MAPAVFPAPLPTPSLKCCVHSCLRHWLHACVVLVIVSLLAEATPHFFSNDEMDDAQLSLPVKRPARLSYFRSPQRSTYRRQYSRYSPRSFMRKGMPWEELPNTSCLRKRCSDSGDCCRRHSLCSVQAGICYDCWYGHPCRENSDCCEKYPYCNNVLKTCSK